MTYKQLNLVYTSGHTDYVAVALGVVPPAPLPGLHSLPPLVKDSTATGEKIYD